MQPISLRMAIRYNGRNQTHAARNCEKCGGPAEPAAQTTTFVCCGQTVRCLKLVSSCVLCGYHWDDDKYEIDNALFAQQARDAFLKRNQGAHDSCAIGRGPSVGKS